MSWSSADLYILGPRVRHLEERPLVTPSDTGPTSGHEFVMISRSAKHMFQCQKFRCLIIPKMGTKVPDSNHNALPTRPPPHLPAAKKVDTTQGEVCKKALQVIFYHCWGVQVLCTTNGRPSLGCLSRGSVLMYIAEFLLRG